jgi:hypothetical protein
VGLFWPLLYPSLVGVVGLLYLWWCVTHASRSKESPPEVDDHEPRRWRRNPRRPRGPRRGPHAPQPSRIARRASAHR